MIISLRTLNGWLADCLKTVSLSFLLPFLCGASYLLNSYAVEAHSPQLKIGVAGRPIFQYVDEDGQFAGLDVELSKLIFKQAGFDIHFQLYPWTRILHLLEKGELDVALSAADSDQRRKYAHFSSQAFRLGHNILYTTRTHEAKFRAFKNLSQLKNTEFRLAVLRGAAYSFEYESLLNASWFSEKLVVVDSPKRTLDLLVLGRVEAFIGSEYGVKKWAQEIGYVEQLVSVFRLMSDSEAETHIMYSKKTVPKEWVDKVDAAMKKLKENGEYDRRINSVLGIATSK